MTDTNTTALPGEALHRALRAERAVRKSLHREATALREESTRLRFEVERQRQEIERLRWILTEEMAA
ncbi:hypothetical protein ACQ3I4_11220 [Zafaria sp. Z1313]|uniref:hypothetical protein n=1 Tax=Zafaria sp. Z1313 TaxID=3423202 RepID=UPI003D30288C